KDRPPLLLPVQVEPHGGADDDKEEQVGADEVVPVGEVIRLAQLLELFLQLGVLERLLSGGGQTETHGWFPALEQRLSSPGQAPGRYRLLILATLAVGCHRGTGMKTRANGRNRRQDRCVSSGSSTSAARRPS